MIYSTQFNIAPDHFRLNTPFKTQVVEKRNNKAIEFVVDQVTGDCYLNDSKALVRAKCLGITLLCPFFHTVAAFVNLTCLSVKVLVGEATRHDIARIASTPLVMVGLVFSALYGALYSPYDGRKLYGTLERFYYHSAVIADCFQPSRQDEYERVECLNCCFA